MTVRKVANGNPTPTRLYVAISGLAKLTAVDGQEGRSVCPCERIERLPELMEYLAERNPEKNKTKIKKDSRRNEQELGSNGEDGGLCPLEAAGHGNVTVHDQSCSSRR